MLAVAGRVWPRRQEGEDGTMRAALVTMEELQDPRLRLHEDGVTTCLTPRRKTEQNRTILSVSQTWESQQHPDPWGWQLRSLLACFAWSSNGMYCEATGKFEARPLSELVLNSTPYSQSG